MLDRRQQQRGKVYLGGRLAFNGRQSTIDCIVRNLSPSGARIELGDAPLLPDDIDLTIERKRVSFLARMIWRGRYEAGLVFHQVEPGEDAMPLDWALLLAASRRANRMLRLQNEQLRGGY